MSWYICELKFAAPVHFGIGEEGGTLADTVTDYAADTWFAALCQEAANAGLAGLIDRLVTRVQQGSLRFSDLLPYQYQAGERRLYLPKPIRLPEKEAYTAGSLAEVKKRSTAFKAQKKQKYLAVGEIGEYIEALRQGLSYVVREPLNLGETALAERVNRRREEPLPYQVGEFFFREEAGLYGLIKAEASDREWLEELLTGLGLSGIGGKRSSGCGKFSLRAGLAELKDNSLEENELLTMLENEHSGCQMALSVVLPKPSESEISAVREGQYSLKKRSGFFSAAGGDKKKNSVYMLAAGSCFKKRISGRLASVGRADGHEIWRYGCGMYAGLMI